MTTKLNFPGNKTNFSHPKCYLSEDFNCSKKLSGEHAISDNILRQQANDNGLIDVNGKLRGRNTFKKSILCKRHNEGLSPLDEIGGRFFKTICDIDIALNKLNYDSVPDVSEFDGQDLERYMLKELFGCLYGRQFEDNHLFKLDKKIALKIIDENLWEDECGFWICTNPKKIEDSMYYERESAIAQIADSQFNVHGGKFERSRWIFFLSLLKESKSIMFEAVSKINIKNSDLIYRPHELIFRKGEVRKIIRIKWPNNSEKRSVEWELIEKNIVNPMPTLYQFFGYIGIQFHNERLDISKT